MAFMVGLFGYLFYSSRNMRFEVSEQGLNLTGGLYGRNIPREQLEVTRARALDLDQDRDYGLSSRTNGAGLPGFGAGWFRLRNGEKCLAFVTDAHRVLYVPTTKGYSVMVSVAEPSAMVQALQRLGR